ncbi:MAG: tRNA dihydrouridine synthase DusB [Candidatus Aureabacteria bacterium]|nr:tRNA dihydrouridine synthase DusB [Candidatus Auribacterota bacterium]
MKIGKIDIVHPLVLAPMEEVTDVCFRLVCKRLGADIVYTEFACSEALIRNSEKTFKKIQVLEAERPVGIQIFGNQESSVEKASSIAEQMQPDFIDFNCGCWSKDIALKGSGAGLLKDLKKLESVVKAAVKGTSLPVTVKTRLGWDKKNLVIMDAARIIENAGVQALTVHCRTRDQGHAGTADWSWLEKIKKVVSIPLIGNGDVRTPMDAKKLFETGCDGIMIGRGALQNPWIFREIKHFLCTGLMEKEPDMETRIQTAVSHLKHSVEWKGEKRGVREFRKYLSSYLRNFPGAAQFRKEIMTYTEMDPVIEKLLSLKI